MTMLPFEDTAGDVLRKAMQGHRVGVAQLAEHTDLPVDVVEAALRGEADDDAWREFATAFGLRADALIALARGASPAPKLEIYGVHRFVSDYRESTVNNYIAWAPGHHEAALFDTGTQVGPILEFLREEGLRVGAIFLTHADTDHVKTLDELLELTGAVAYLGDREEDVDGAKRFIAGREFKIGRLRIETRHTHGHTPGGISYIVHGLDRPVAFTGDALFARSMGGAPDDYADAIESGRHALFSLPDHTLVCPGHGPMTTIGDERHWNPFFANA
jgi:glyoxylase-like metal-dependent hydrolase (beta-lactamase superfamily II)